MKPSAVNPADPRADRVQEAVGVLRAGGIVALPTETFYGLAADSRNETALRRVNPLKGKPAGTPILLLVSSIDQARSCAASLPPTFETLAGAFWPGPLTLVVPASHRLSREITGGTGTVAVRMPGLALPRRIAEALGAPITGTSANLHGENPSRTAVEVVRAFPDSIELVLDGGAAPGGAPSTLVDLSREQPRILRAGPIPATSLAPFLGPPDAPGGAD